MTGKNFNWIWILCWLSFVGWGWLPASKAQSSNPYPFSTDSTHLTIWNGAEYVPFFMKGVNLGVAVPGTFPGELAATRKDYANWFQGISAAGFNGIRIYTLHYPWFYEVLDSFNTANPQHPLFFIQGIWLDEEIPNYNNDLYELSTVFLEEIENNVNCVHGNNNIAPRFGKAFGDYQTDASKWCMAYIIGREIYPTEVQTANSMNPAMNAFTGDHFEITNASPAEAWITSMLDHTVAYEQLNYNTARPISASSWPTLDPLQHPEEKNRGEDTASIDISKIQLIDAPAGLFVSYHAYPYYPDFVSQQTSYNAFNDQYGPNSYMGYLTEMKAHYAQYPLIIAEYGVPSSLAIAHYASSGMNHGGFDEFDQGQTNIRLLNTIKSTNCGGGIQFEWIDEWFKSTWITDPIDYIPDSRILWHNRVGAEQNFGLVAFEKTIQADTIINLNPNDDITYATAKVNYNYFEMEIGLKDPLAIPDEMWICYDTYASSLGESILSTGDTIPTRSEFALHLTNYAASLYVTEAYDLFGIWHNLSGPNNLYHSIATDGAPWEILRLRNNSAHADVQYIGDLQVNYSFQPPSSNDAVTIYDDKITVRIPWSYLNFVSPDQMKVFHDDRATTPKEDTISDGILVAINYQGQWHVPASRMVWDPWVSITDTAVEERYKTSYYVMQDNLPAFNTPAIAVSDSFDFSNSNFPVQVNAAAGVLQNDLDLDGDEMVSLITQNPKYGQVFLDNNGAFEYAPFAGFSGMDTFRYCVYDGYTLSRSNKVVLVLGQVTEVEPLTFGHESSIELYPNPAHQTLHIRSNELWNKVQVFNMAGQLIDTRQLNSKTASLDISTYTAATYIAVFTSNEKVRSQNFVKQ